MKQEEKMQNLQDAVRGLREHYYDSIAAEVRLSTKSYAEIGREFGVSEQTVYNVARLHGISRTRSGADVPSTPEQGGEDGEL